MPTSMPVISLWLLILHPAVYITGLLTHDGNLLMYRNLQQWDVAAQYCKVFYSVFSPDFLFPQGKLLLRITFSLGSKRLRNL